VRWRENATGDVHELFAAEAVATSLLFEKPGGATMKQTIGWLTMTAILGAASAARAQDAIDIHPEEPGLPAVALPAPRFVPPPPPAPIADPAATRNGAMTTALTLDKGEVSFTNRALLSAEVAVGATSWLELGIKTTPVLLAIPGVGPKNSFWAGSVRLRAIHGRLFTLTAESEGIAFAGWAGLRAGLSMRLGVDRVAFHGSGSGFKLWKLDDGDRARTHEAMLFSGGLHVRVHRRVKLMCDVSYYRDRKMDTLVATPAVRIHGHHFAADFGLLVMTAKQEPNIALPLVNLSVTY
jgi:hypothetical protein